MTRNILSKSGILLFLAVDLMLIVAWLGVQRGMILYGIFLLTAVSPLGEQIIRLYYGCSPLSRTDQIVKIEPIYHEVLDKARQINRHLPPDIRVYISNEDRSDIYSLGRDTLVTTEAALARPDAELKANMDPLKAGLAHEQYVTSLIHAIYEAAYEARDFRTMQFLDWFVKEQGEEETNATDLIKKMELFGSDPKGLYMLDQELAARTYAAPSLTL